MVDVETRLKIAAIDTSAQAFKQVAQQIEQMTQRVTKSQRVLVDSHKTAVQQMEAVAASGYTTLSRLASLGGVALGAGAIVEAAKASVMQFATVDQQARALSVSTGISLDKIKEFYEHVDKTAVSAKVSVEQLRNAGDSLARAFGIEGAQGMIAGVAQAAAGMHTSAEEAALFNVQLVKTLKLTKDEIPAAFDSIVGAAKGGRVQAAELAKGISDVSTHLADIGMTGPKSLHQVEAAMETVGQFSTNAEQAVAGVQAIIDAVDTKRLNDQFLHAGINMQHELEKGAKAGKSALDVMVEQGHKAALIIQRRHPGITIEEAYAELTKRNIPMRDALIQLFAHRDITAQVQDRIAKSGGAMAAASETMIGGVSGSLEDFKNKLIEGKDALGEFFSYLYERKNQEPYGPLIGHLWGKPPGTPMPPAPERDIHGEPIPGKYKPIAGLMSDWGSLPLIPSQPGSTTERTALAQLDALRRLERSALFGGLGGAGIGGSSGAAAGGGSPGGPESGRGSAGGRTGGPSARRQSFGHPSKGGGGGGSSPGGSPDPAVVAEIKAAAGGDAAVEKLMMGIYAGESSHIPGHYDTNINSKESSYGPFQLNTKGGLGNVFEKDTGLKLSDPSTRAAQAKWLAQKLKSDPGLVSQFYGYRDRGKAMVDKGWGSGVGAAAAGGSTGGGGGAADVAERLDGLRDRDPAGHRDIMRFLSNDTAGMDPARVDWCSRFVGQSVRGSGGTPPRGSDIATNWATWGNPVDKGDIRRGDVVVNRRGLRPGARGGHVAIATGPASHGQIPVIEGDVRSPNYGRTGEHMVTHGHESINDDVRRAPPGPESRLEDKTMRVKVAYDFDAADVRTHSRAYARRSFNKEAKSSRYSSYTDLGTPA